MEVHLEGVAFVGTTSVGAYLYDRINATVVNCRFQSNRQHGLFVDTNVIVSVMDSHFEGNADWGIWARGARDVSVSNTRFEGNNGGIIVTDVHDVSIVSSTFNGHPYHGGVRLRGTLSKVDISDIVFSSNHPAGIRFESRDRSQATNVNISGCRFESTSSTGKHIHVLHGNGFN